jgi:lipopolysaccharide export system permease protein
MVRMKVTLYKYILSEIWPVFTASLVVFIFIVLAGTMLNLSEWIVNHGLPLRGIAMIVFDLLPGLVLFALPATVLMSVFLAFLRLSADNEIQAIKTSGIGLYQLLPPVVFVSGIAFLIACAISLFGAPLGNRSFKDLVFRMAYSKPDMGIRERIFCEPFQGVTFYVNHFSVRDKTMSDIFVVDRRDPSMTNSIVAKEGGIFVNTKTKIITVHFQDGIVFTTDKNLETARTIKFSTYDLSLDTEDLMPALSSRTHDPNEMFVQDLIKKLKTAPKNQARYNEMVMELMEKFSIPLAVFLMGMIGAPLGAQIRAGGRFAGIAISLLIFLVYYLFMAAMRGLRASGFLSPYIGAWLPDLFLLASCVFLMKRAGGERSINLLNRILKLQEY